MSAGKKLFLDGSNNTYIYESSDGVIDFFGDNVHLASFKQNGTQSEVVVNEGSGDVDFRVEANNNQHAFFVEAEGSGNVGIRTSTPMSASDGITGLEITGSDYPGLTLKSTGSTAVHSLWADTSGNLKIQNNTNNATRMTVSSSGYIGIQTTSPTEELSVYGAASSPATSGTARNGILSIESSNGNSLYFGGYTASPYGMWLQVSNSALSLIHI